MASAVMAQLVREYRKDFLNAEASDESIAQDDPFGFPQARETGIGLSGVPAHVKGINPF